MKTDVPRSALQAHPFITTIAERVRIASAMRAVGCVQHRRPAWGDASQIAPRQLKNRQSYYRLDQENN